MCAARAKRARHGSGVDPYHAPPSRIVHARSLPDDASAEDLRLALVHHGEVIRVVPIRGKQALVEFVSIGSATQCVQGPPILLRGRRVLLNFSKSQEVAVAEPGHVRDPAPPGRVLHIAVQAATQPVGCEVMHAICAPHGAVQRIAMVRKRGVQALVEFGAMDEAARAMAALDGAQIYAGCCALRVQYSRVERLNITYRSDDTRDYTSAAGPGPAVSSARASGRPEALPGSVLVLHELAAEFNCQRLFNLVCLYANPVKVRFLPDKKGVALVQVTHPAHAKAAIEHLKGAEAFGHRMTCGLSRLDWIAEAAGDEGRRLADGSPCTQTFHGSKCHRFRIKPTARHRVCPPTAAVHYFNAPPAAPPAALVQLCKSCGAQEPVEVTDIPPAEPGTTARGMLFWDSAADAATAVALTNNAPMAVGTQVYTVKLDFSTASRDQ